MHFCFAGELVVVESERQIPVAYQVDVLVIGGSTGAVSAAVAAADKGASVFLMAPRPYLGEDICASLRIWLEKDETASSGLAKSIFSDDRIATPMKIKKSLDQALIDSKVKFLYSCMPCDVLKDSGGKPCGAIMVNRAGRQAVIAKVVIDATDYGLVARLAGAKFTPYPSGKHSFSRVTIGGGKDVKDGVQVRQLDFSFPVGSGQPDKKAGAVSQQAFVVEYQLKMDVPDESFQSLSKAEQTARDMTNLGDFQYGSESIFEIPQNHLISRKPTMQAWDGAGKIQIESFIPEGVDRLFVLSPLGDIPRESAIKLSHPVAMMEFGNRIGVSAAEMAQNLPAPKGCRIEGARIASSVKGEIREPLHGIRPYQKVTSSLTQEARSIPVLGEYDVVVVGGGTSGAPAGISAARKGSRTLVIEYLPELGGVTTMGMINKYFYGNKVGFTSELDAGVKESPGGTSLVRRTEWFRRELVKAGADIWFNTLGCGAFVENNQVKGVVVATPRGRGVVLAKVVIDSTGNSDIAIASGASYMFIDGTDIAVQGAGLPGRALGATYSNSDYLFSDETDMVDVMNAFLLAKKMSRGFDLGQLLDTRERRRIVGDYVLTPLDLMNQRTYDDTIVQASSTFDTHGYTVDSVFYLKSPDKKKISANVPYRCLLPKGIDGILVTGLGISAHRDAMPPIRMQPDMQNLGYAAGIAAAMATKLNGMTRKIDVRQLQQELLEKKNLSPDILTENDSPNPDVNRIAAAAKNLSGTDAIPLILSCPEKSIPVLKRNLKSVSSEKDKLMYAQLLGAMGDASGIDILTAELGKGSWDKGWNFKGMGQFGPSFSQMDTIVVALGMTKDKRAVPAILARMKELTPESEFSHFRSTAMALERIGDRSAAGMIAEKLAMPGISGHAMLETPESVQKDLDRSEALRELILARALYNLGDKDGIGKKILIQYSQDLRGPLARHATLVLESAK